MYLCTYLRLVYRLGLASLRVGSRMIQWDEGPMDGLIGRLGRHPETQFVLEFET